MLGSVVKDKDGKYCSGTVDVIKVEDLDKYIDDTIYELLGGEGHLYSAKFIVDAAMGASAALRILKDAITRAPKR